MAELSVAEAFSLIRLDGWALVQVSGWPNTMTEIEDRLRQMFGGPVPTAFGEVGRFGGNLLMRIAPERIWIVTNEGVQAPSLEQTFDPSLATIVDLGEGRVRLQLRSPRALDVMPRCVAVDWADSAYAPGRYACAALHRIPALILRESNELFEIFIPRTFGKSVEEWIVDAAGG